MAGGRFCWPQKCCLDHWARSWSPMISGENAVLRCPEPIIGRGSAPAPPEFIALVISGEAGKEKMVMPTENWSPAAALRLPSSSALSSAQAINSLSKSKRQGGSILGCREGSFFGWNYHKYPLRLWKGLSKDIGNPP